MNTRRMGRSGYDDGTPVHNLLMGERRVVERMNGTERKDTNFFI